MALFSSTDSDGDKLTVVAHPGFRTFEFTVSGEDGHRTVYLSDNDAARLRRQLTLAAEERSTFTPIPRA
jgi:hypothetical protein